MDYPFPGALKSSSPPHASFLLGRDDNFLEKHGPPSQNPQHSTLSRVGRGRLIPQNIPYMFTTAVHHYELQIDVSRNGRKQPTVTDFRTLKFQHKDALC